jgi:hypothetical protein
MEDDCWSIEALRDVNSLGGFHRAKEELSGKVERTAWVSPI